MTAAKTPSEESICGLCARCRHVRRVHSQRAALFYLCRRSGTDPHFPKYPSLPVLACCGYEPVDG